MALPVLDKTYNTTLNTTVRNLGFANNYQINREVMFQIKDKLVNMAVPWTVSGSSDGVTAAMDGVDRWLSRADVSFGNVSQDGQSGVSWIVLRQTAINPKFEVMIKCDSGWSLQGTDAEIYFSPTVGFGAVNGGTDGTTSDASPPTATDQIALITEAGTWLGHSPGSGNERHFRLDFWQSTDGKVNRIFAWDITGQKTSMHVRFEVPKLPVSQWTNPCMAMWYAATTAVHQYADLNDVARLLGNNPNGGSMPLYHTSEGRGSAMNGQNIVGVNGLTGDYDLHSIGLQSATVGAEGRHGEIFDLWWVPTNLINGTTMPLTPSPTREFAVHDDLLMVHDGTIPVLI